MDISLAADVVTLMIILSGIFIGLGKALRIKRLELFGLEELLQSIINAAIIGAFALIVATIQQISSNVNFLTCGTDLATELQCQMETLTQSSFLLMQEAAKTSLTLGYFESLILHFGSFDIQILRGLSSLRKTLEQGLLFLHINANASALNYYFANFIGSTMITLFLPLGIIFRSFFATRKLGGFLISFSLGFFLLYPYIILVFPSPSKIVDDTTAMFSEINDNPDYATMPIVDLNNNNAVAEKLYSLSQGDFVGSLITALQGLSQSNAALFLFVAVAPLLAFAITIIFVMGLTLLLGSHFALRVGVI